MLSSLEGASLSPQVKDRFFRTYQRQIERLTAILNGSELWRLCSRAIAHELDRTITAVAGKSTKYHPKKSDDQNACRWADGKRKANS
jgi:hypothetical protein